MHITYRKVIDLLVAPGRDTLPDCPCRISTIRELDWLNPNSYFRMVSDCLMSDVPCTAPIAPIDIERSQIQGRTPLRPLPGLQRLAVTVRLRPLIITRFTAWFAS